MEIKRLDLANLSKEQLELYEKLTTEENICYLHSKNPYNIEGLTYIALAAINDDKPVGLLLATGEGGDSGVRLASLKSLFVEVEYRHKQIGTNLMIALENELRDSQCILASMIYQTDISNLREFEHILDKCMWSAPFPLIYRYYFKGANFNPPWLSKNYHFPENFTLFFWSELTEKEKNELRRRENQWNFPSEISPFINEENIEYANSLGLRVGDRIIGWAITHRLDESTIRYSSLYIQPEYKFRGFSIQLLIHSMKMQKDLIAKGHPAIWAVFDLNLRQTDQIWQHFIERRLAPYADKKLVFNQTWKDLSK